MDYLTLTSTGSYEDFLMKNKRNPGGAASTRVVAEGYIILENETKWCLLYVYRLST